MSGGVGRTTMRLPVREGPPMEGRVRREARSIDHDGAAADEPGPDRALVGGAGPGAGLRRRRRRAADELLEGRQHPLDNLAVFGRLLLRRLRLRLRLRRLRLRLRLRRLRLLLRRLRLRLRRLRLRLRRLAVFGRVLRPAPVLDQHADAENPDACGGDDGRDHVSVRDGEAGRLIGCHGNLRFARYPGNPFPEYTVKAVCPGGGREGGPAWASPGAWRS